VTETYVRFTHLYLVMFVLLQCFNTVVWSTGMASCL